MYTQCPHCLTVHALNAAQIALGRGELVCGVCEKHFNGLERLADRLVGGLCGPGAAACRPDRTRPARRARPGRRAAAVAAAAVCRLSCDLPAYADPERIALLNRDVSPHPSVADALLITASFRNDAVWPQAWPVLELSMADLDGRLVALRRFSPVDYLGQPPERPVLAPGESVLVELEVVDPGNQAIAFEFAFL
jgi:predicted Zn finger-like uncharacterized protein